MRHGLSRMGLLAGAAAVAALAPQAAFAIPRVGVRAPLLNLKKSTGAKFQLKSALGKQPILLNFFATW